MPQCQMVRHPINYMNLNFLLNLAEKFSYRGAYEWTQAISYFGAPRNVIAFFLTYLFKDSPAAYTEIKAMLKYW